MQSLYSVDVSHFVSPFLALESFHGKWLTFLGKVLHINLGIIDFLKQKGEKKEMQIHVFF